MFSTKLKTICCNFAKNKTFKKSKWQTCYETVAIATLLS